MKTGIAHLPLHGGSCPKWLFPRMRNMAGAISEIISDEYGNEELLKRLADPYWFQAFGCVLGYDWHSSGLTTTTTAALKMSINKLDIGIKICGGKGATSRKTPAEINEMSRSIGSDAENLVYASRMSAKIDSAAVQDSYQLYHHCFAFTGRSWCVIQQGMNSETGYARRYHWLSSNMDDFVNEPHNAICSVMKQEKVLDMTALMSSEARKTSVDIVNDGYIIKHKILSMPPSHDFRIGIQTAKTLQAAYEIQPQNYEELLSIRGIGPKAVRALALVGQLIYGKEPSWNDPAEFSFSHGGKDGIPYPVDRQMMDKNIQFLKDAVNESRMGLGEKIYAMKKLNALIGDAS